MGAETEETYADLVLHLLHSSLMKNNTESAYVALASAFITETINRHVYERFISSHNAICGI